MKTIATILGGAALFSGGLLLLLPLGTLFGGIAGWAVGLFFGDTILGIAGQLGVKDITMFQFGAFLGFVGGFLRTRTEVKSNK